MNRGLVVRCVLGGLVALAAADAAQAGIIFRRGWRNDCCCDGYANYGYRRTGYGWYGGSAYSNAYVMNCCDQQPGTMVAAGFAPAPYTVAYADPNAWPANSGANTAEKIRLRVQVPTAETKIWVDQHYVQSMGTDRSIDVPVTAAQKVTVTAQWVKDGRDVVRKKEVAVRSGQDATVSFSDADMLGQLGAGEAIRSSPSDKP